MSQLDLDYAGKRIKTSSPSPRMTMSPNQECKMFPLPTQSDLNDHRLLSPNTVDNFLDFSYNQRITFETQTIQIIKPSDEMIRLNMRGTVFEVRKEVLVHREKTYFHTMLSSGHWTPDQGGEYFIDRNCTGFDKILDYLSSGTLSYETMTQLEIDCVKDNLDYFQIPLPTEYHDYKTCSHLLGHHRGHVYAVVQLADGRICSGAYDTTIRVWNAKSEFCDGVLIGHDSAVMCLVQVRGGYLYSGSADSTMKMWDLTSMQCVGTITGHDNTVSTLVELSDGRLLTGSWDTTVKLWSLSKGSWSCEHTFTGHSDWITCLITLLDGRIATGSLDHTVRVWSLDSRTCDLVFNVHDIVFALTEVAQENRVFCCLGSGSIKKLDTLTGESIFYCVRDLAPFTVEARCSMVLSDGRYCIGSCQSLSLWDPSNGGSMEKMLTRPFNHQWLLLHISSKDPFERGKTIIKVENFDADTVTNDLSTAEVCAFGVEGAICVCQLRDGRICAGGSHGTVQIWS